MATYDLGDGVNLRHFVYDRNGQLADANVTLSVTKPDATTATPTVTRTSLGQYDANTFVADQLGDWAFRWTVAGAVTDVASGTFTVADPAPRSYASLPLVKAALGKITDDDRDDLIEMAIRAASRQIDRITGRRFYADQVATTRTFPTLGRTFSRTAGSALLVDDIASSTGLVVAGNAVTLTGITGGPDNALVYGQPITYLQGVGSWLTGYTSVQVTARWGWPVVPDEVAMATQLLATRLYRRKDSPQGVISSADWGSVRVSRVDPDVEALIGGFIIPGFA